MEEYVFTYKKQDTNALFNSLDKDMFSNVQNYIPIYNSFFDMNINNFDNITLNQKYHISEINNKQTNNIFESELINLDNNEKKKKDIFIKYSPLLDPIKYMVGKYDISNSDLMNLPSLSNNCHPKILDKNNSAYVDGFFTYLTSQLLNEHGFSHGVDYYGSFLCLQNNFVYNAIDDIDYLSDSDFFNKNKDKLFTVTNEYHDDLLNIDTRNYKKRLNISGKEEAINLSDIKDIDEFKDIFQENITNIKTTDKELVFNFTLNTSHTSSGSTCSSRSSNTELDDSGSDCSSEDTLSEMDSCSTISDDILNVIIDKLPVQSICLEKCDKTLDSLILEGELSIDEWESILLQIIMMLITYQHCYGLTHNDLHTNNIMYNKTDKKYLCYRYNEKYYKIPTYGKVFKIIDFGRAIYKFRGNIICSDSYHPEGDAATQYNFEPYFNENKPRLEPNFSFDLCRLACSLFDFLIDEDDEKKKLNPIQKLIKEWCTDDKERNILYKKKRRRTLSRI